MNKDMPEEPPLLDLITEFDTQIIISKAGGVCIEISLIRVK
jgi:hypothetical protein